MSEKRWILICRFCKHVHTQEYGGIGRVRGGGAAGRRDVGDKGSRARQRTWGTYVCTYGVCLSRGCLPCSFLRSSINETRVQSRRMSNKYVSYSRPSFHSTVAPTDRLLTLFVLNPRVTAFLVALLRESSSYHDRCRSASAHFNPFAYCSTSRPFSHPFGFRTVWSGTKSSFYSRVHASDSSQLALSASLGATIGLAWLRSVVAWTSILNSRCTIITI